MKISTATSVLFQYSIHDAVALVARLGFDGVDIWGGRPHVYRQDLTADELRDLRRQIEDSGLTVVSLMPAFYRYPHSLSNPNPRVRADSVDYMRQCIENAAILGAGIVLVVPDHSLYGQGSEDARARFVESLAQVAEHAAHFPLRLGLEILYTDETDFVNSAADAQSIIRAVGAQALGVVLDTGTLNLSHEPLADIFASLGSRVLQVHVNDNHGEREQQNLIPGDGTYDFPALIRGLREQHYTGFLSAELSKGYAERAEEALRTTAERLRAWLAEG